jgi:ketosteroid isomerase-like protein
MAAEESNPTVEVARTPEAIIEAISAGLLVEATRAAYALFNAGSLGALLEAYEPEAEWHTRTDLADSRTYRGREEIALLAAEWGDSFDDLRMEPREFFETGGKVVVVLQMNGRIKDSDERVEMEEVHVFSFRDGRVSDVREYPTRGEALKVLGLPESATFANRFVEPT